jgi:NAD(P)-dependent dehydrogenase (short-subunit alcohol dehydrogenase family)
VTYDYVRRLQGCVRCQTQRRFGIAWPEGFVCIQCIQRATKIRGSCPGCGKERLLVGRNGDGAPICVDCAGIRTCFRCRRCQKEDRTWYSQTCLSCSLDQRLRLVLGVGGTVPAGLLPLLERLVAMENPIAGLTWLNKSAVRERLQALGRGEVPLTHEGIDRLAGGQGREFLRELLVEVGVLPYRDKYLASFRAWVPKRLASIKEADIEREIRLYVSWHEERELAVRAEAGRLDAGRANRARDSIDSAVRFLRFTRARGRSLAELRQEDVDAWFAEAGHPFGALDYLVFAAAHRRCRRLELPRSRRVISAGAPLAQLSEIVARLVEDESLELGDRVAGLLVLLFAQTVTRVAGLRVAAISLVDGEIAVNLGQHPVTLPEPVARVFSRYLARRINIGTTNTETDFLFPGCRPGQHITAFQLTKHMNALGITRTERQGALTHLVNEAPAAVVAKATGYSLGSTAARSVLFGPDWARYAALKSSASG